ncbi:hypothetical protein BKA56DRAFT_654874 [Ilyonectria sp. MPI-CAGE-AT-0026]|nr:hypothetical protein BKA56DRAFT_654874 [Ilyonectria sp. MPI-CAGE-AT-0026]
MPEQFQMGVSAAQGVSSRLSSHRCLPEDDPKLAEMIYFYCWQCSSRFCCSDFLSKHQYKAHRITDVHCYSRTGSRDKVRPYLSDPQQPNYSASDLEFSSHNSQDTDFLAGESLNMVPSDWDSLLEILNDSGLWDKANSSCRMIVPAPAAIHTENWQSPLISASKPRESSTPMGPRQMLNTPPPDSQTIGLTTKGL